MSPPRAHDIVAEEAQEPETNSEEVEADCYDAVPDEGQSEQHEQNQEHHPVKHQQQSKNYNQRRHQQFSRQSEGIQKFRNKSTFKRIDVDPSRKYHTPEARESWGPNVKGKKFRKEKGKKKRSTGTGARIDGSVRSVRLDA